MNSVHMLPMAPLDGVVDKVDRGQNQHALAHVGQRDALDSTFHEVDVSVSGAVARFAAYHPRRPGGRVSNGVAR